MAAIQARETACAPFLKSMGGNPTQALKLALVDPPYATKTESVKVASCDLVCKALLMIKEAEPPSQPVSHLRSWGRIFAPRTGEGGVSLAT